MVAAGVGVISNQLLRFASKRGGWGAIMFAADQKICAGVAHLWAAVSGKKRQAGLGEPEAGSTGRDAKD
jgi:hypothetical protein